MMGEVRSRLRTRSTVRPTADPTPGSAPSVWYNTLGPPPTARPPRYPRRRLRRCPRRTLAE